MTVREALSVAASRLAAGSDTPRLDAELLMAHALGIERETLLLSRQNEPVPPDFDQLVERRAGGEPIAYITGMRSFWTIDLEVEPGVLIPRPDSETLIEAALDHFGQAGPATILDLGTGPGTLLLAALDQWPDARGLGIDASSTALSIAKRNADALHLSIRAEFRFGNWADGVEGCYDLILCNPPYIEDTARLPRDVADWEPPEALFAGQDGLDDYRLLAPQIGRLLAPAGIACVEIGWTQEHSAGALFAAQGLRVSCRRDLGGRPRCLVLRRPEAP